MSHHAIALDRCSNRMCLHSWMHSWDDRLLAMRAPRALAQVDCSHNRIATIGTSLAPHRYLTRINIASNTLKNLDGVQLCPSLVIQSYHTYTTIHH